MTTDPLLDAIFAPAAAEPVAALAAVHRRRVRRHLTRFAAGGASLVAIAWLLLPAPRPVPRVTAPVIAIVATRPLAEHEIVRTAPRSVEVVTTASQEANLTRIAVTDLLDLLGPGRAAVLGSGPEQRLIEF
jgi:hypothetical protein